MPEEEDTNQKSDTIPRPRIQALSDMIFGLALSIGALTLLSVKPNSVADIVASLVGFGWAFTVLAIVWVRYTRVMSVLPVEGSKLAAANMVLLFLVSIEPYLYNLIGVSFGSVPGTLDPNTTTALYAVDMGALFTILAYFTHEITIEDRKLVPVELLRTWRLQRNTVFITTILFFASIHPIFWSVTVLGIPTRFIVWMGTFILSIIRRGIERSQKS